MKRHHTPAVLAAVFALALPLAACARKAEVPAAEVVPVLAAKVERRAVPIELSAIGNVEALQSVAVQARVSGEIDQVAFSEGQDVQPGDLLFTIDPRPYQAALDEAQARVERDRALAKNAEETAARYADLVKKDYVTPEQYEQMRAGGEAARATAKADEAAVENARLQLSYTRITAPIAGRTGSIQVHRGNMLRPNDERTLVTINQIRPIAVAFTVPESAFDQIRRARADSKLSVVAAALPRPGRAGGAGNGARKRRWRQAGDGRAFVRRQHGRPDDRHGPSQGDLRERLGRPLARPLRRCRSHAGPRSGRPRDPGRSDPDRAAGLLRLRRQGRLDRRVEARHRRAQAGRPCRDREGPRRPTSVS